VSRAYRPPTTLINIAASRPQIARAILRLEVNENGAAKVPTKEGGTPMRVRAGQDFATGILFALIALAALYIGADYPMGTPQRPGTGVLPRILSLCLLATGVFLIGKAIIVGDVAMERWAWRPLAAITIATILFGLIIDDLGLVIAMVLSMSIAALGALDTRWREFASFLFIMIVGSWALFIWLLGMPIPMWPVRVPKFLTFFFG
jgi:hypothetical protein